jgi:hypothetical protein
MLTIRGEKLEEKKEGEEDKKVYLYERMYGSFSRSFALPSNVDAANIVAEFEKGILKIRLPKFADVKPKGRKVEVKSGLDVFVARDTGTRTWPLGFLGRPPFLNDRESLRRPWVFADS